MNSQILNRTRKVLETKIQQAVESLNEFIRSIKTQQDEPGRRSRVDEGASWSSRPTLKPSA